MKNLNFLFFFFLTFISCNQPHRAYAEVCSFEPKIAYLDCQYAVLTVDQCTNCLTYLWSNGCTAKNNPVTQSGTYGVTVTCSGGLVSVSSIIVDVDQPCPEQCSVDIEKEQKCGYVTLTAICVEGDCTSFTWNTGEVGTSINVTVPGLYSVSMTTLSNQCTSVANENVSLISSGPSVSISGNTFFCEGSSTTLLAESSSIVEYCWNTGAKSPGLLVTQPGTYTVTVTSIVTGCTATASKEVVMVHSPQTPTISAEVQGDKVVLTAFPPAVQYIWSNGETGPTITVNSSMTLSVRVKNHEGCISEASCPVPVMVLVKEVNTGGNGSDPSNCNKNGIVTSNGMSYGAVIKKPNNQLFLYAPPGANQYSCTWNQGQTGGNKGWVLANSNVGTHQYLLQCKFYGSEDWHWFCFQYTIVNNLDDDNTESRSIYSSEEMFIPEEYREEIEEFLEDQKSSIYSTESILNTKVYPVPTYSPVEVKSSLQIPESAKPGLYFLKIELIDLNGISLDRKVEKVIKN